MKWIVVETVRYEVEAATADDAMQRVMDNEKRDEWCIDVVERYVEENQP